MTVGVHRCCSHPTEIAKSGGRLKVDREWYLAQQLLPPIARLCEPIEGTSQAQLAECLGLDSSRFHKSYMGHDGELCRLGRRRARGLAGVVRALTILPGPRR